MISRRAAAFASIGLSFWLIPSAIAQCPQPNIKRIEVQGNHQISEGAIRRHIASRVGQPLDPETVDSDVKSIRFEIKGVEKVVSSIRCEVDGTVLIITVYELK